MHSEEWRDIPIKGMDYVYQASFDGTIRHVKQGKTIKIKNIYTPFKDGKYGYPQVTIRMANGKYITKNVHRLVALAWVPNPENKELVNHIDGDKTNYHSTNLEWCDHSHNHLHAFRTGLRVPKNRGENHVDHKLTDKEVQSIRELYKENKSQYFLAKKYNVNQSTISRIVNSLRRVHS